VKEKQKRVERVHHYTLPKSTCHHDIVRQVEQGLEDRAGVV